MDSKLRAAQVLVQKLANGCGSAQLEAVAEMRLFSKWDDQNRMSLAEAGAIPLLVQLLHAKNGNQNQHHTNSGTNTNECSPVLFEKAIVALLNLSLHPPNKLAIVRTPGALDSIIWAVGCDGMGNEARGCAATLLQSLMEDTSLGGATAAMVAAYPGFAKSLVKLLQEGGSRAKGDALHALFQAITKANASRSEEGLLLKEELLREGVISLLLKLVACGKPRLAEECFGLLAAIARGDPRAADAIVQNPTALPLAFRAMDQHVSSMPPRTAENAAAMLLELCESGGSAAVAAMLAEGESAVVSAGRLAASVTASPRAKRKADAILLHLGQQHRASSAPASLCGPASASSMSPSNFHGMERFRPPTESAPNVNPRQKPKVLPKSANKYLARAMRSLNNIGKHNST